MLDQFKDQRAIRAQLDPRDRKATRVLTQLFPDLKVIPEPRVLRVLTLLLRVLRVRRVQKVILARTPQCRDLKVRQVQLDPQALKVTRAQSDLPDPPRT